MLVAVIFMLLPLKAVGQANTYYDKGQGATPNHTTLKSRMALVGHNCMVSRLADGIAVGSGSKNLSYLCDENLTNYYAIPSLANVTLIAGSPIVAVKDMKHYIDKDTKAGFKISGNSNLLKLTALQTNYQIWFYKDGEVVGKSEIDQLAFSVLDLSILNIDLKNSVDIIAKTQPTEDYDEIALVNKIGLEVKAINSFKIYYAFVGDGVYSLTNSKIKEYDSNITLDGNKKLIDDDLTNKAVLSAVINLGSSVSTQVIAKNANGTGDTFPKGTEAGFVYKSFEVVGVAITPVISFLDKNGNDIKTTIPETSVLDVSLGAEDKKISVIAPCDFSGVKLTIAGVSLLSEYSAKYAFIVPKPITAGHRCEMSPTASLDLCNCDSHYQLKWDRDSFPNAKWAPENNYLPNGVKFDDTNNTLDFSETDSYKNGTGEKVTVKMVLKNVDGCTQTITINYGGSTEQKPEDKKETVLYNTDP